MCSHGRLLLEMVLDFNVTLHKDTIVMFVHVRLSIFSPQLTYEWCQDLDFIRECQSGD